MKSVFDRERGEMDYGYFPRFDAARNALHDSIVAGFIAKRVEERAPWLVYMCGSYGSGKSHAVRHLWPSHPCAYIDPDAIKTSLCDQKDNNLLHLEATFVALLAERALVHRSISAIVDGSLHDAEWYKSHWAELRRKHPAYRIAIVKVECDFPTAWKRCQQRALVTKRQIPQELVRKIFDKIPTSFQTLRTIADCIIIIDNNHLTNKPTVKSVSAQHPPWMQT